MRRKTDISTEKIIGLDFGSSNTRIYVKGLGVAVNEPSYAAYETSSGQSVAYGAEVKLMSGKNGNGICPMQLVKNGAVSEYELSKYFLKELMKKARANIFVQNKVIATVPGSLTQVERNTLEELVLECGVSGIALIDSSIAAAIGAGISTKDPKGKLIVDIGSGKTKIALIASGGVSCSENINVAGDSFDKNIAEYIRYKFGVKMGMNACEQIKISAGSASEQTDIKELEVTGRSAFSGLPASFRIYSEEIREALTPSLDIIADGIRTVLENAPAELCGDIADTGITIMGGSSRLPGIDIYLAQKTSLPVYNTKRAGDCAIDGIGKIIENNSYEVILTYAKKHFRRYYN